MASNKIKTIAARILGGCVLMAALPYLALLASSPVAQDKGKKETGVTFKAIVVQGAGNVTLIMADKEAITPDDPDTGTFEVKDGVLYLGGAANFTIKAKELNRLELNAAGSVQAKDLKAKNIQLKIDGAGSAELGGVIEDQEIVIAGAGRFNGEALKGKKADIVLTGSGAAIVNVSDALKVNLSGSGSVEHIGTPKIESVITGSGSVGPRRPSNGGGAGGKGQGGGDGGGNGGRGGAGGAAGQAGGGNGQPGRPGLPGGASGDVVRDNRLGARLAAPSQAMITKLGLAVDDGLVIEQIKDGSPAAKAGLKPADILLKLNGKRVTNNALDLIQALNDIKADATVDAVVLRQGKEETIKITFGPAPR